MKLKKVNSSTKYQVFKLYKNDILKFILKERLKKNITKSKTRYYLQTDNYQFISSLYPLNKTDNFNGIFSIEDNKVLSLDFKSKCYTLTINSNDVEISEVANV